MDGPRTRPAERAHAASGFSKVSSPIQPIPFYSLVLQFNLLAGYRQINSILLITLILIGICCTIFYN